MNPPPLRPALRDGGRLSPLIPGTAIRRFFRRNRYRKPRVVGEKDFAPAKRKVVLYDAVEGYSLFRLERSDRRMPVPQESPKIRFFRAGKEMGDFWRECTQVHDRQKSHSDTAGAEKAVFDG